MKKQLYFVSTNFKPDLSRNFKKLENDIYLLKHTDIKYRKRALYDWGWGQELGFEIIPKPTFEELIFLVSNFDLTIRNNKLKMNFYGAISVIMQDYVEELIDFLTKKLPTDFFENTQIKNNFSFFSFNSEKTRVSGRIPGGVGVNSYENIFKQPPQWLEISERVISLIYDDNQGNG